MSGVSLPSHDETLRSCYVKCRLAGSARFIRTAASKAVKIDGRMVYLWRAVDAEGEVLDVLVQSKRNKHAALKLMRKQARPAARYRASPQISSRSVVEDASL